MSLPAVVRPIQLSPAGGRLWPTMFRSETLNLRCNVFVYTPPGVGQKSKRLAGLPVLYLLHGMWGSEIDWPFKGDAQRILDREILAGRARPMIVAMPHDGLADNGTFYNDWHDPASVCPHAGLRFEQHMIGDLVNFVEVELTGRRRDRGQRAVAGLSMGGFGSLTLALRNPEMYAAVGSLSSPCRPIGDWRYPELGLRIFGPMDSSPESYRRRRDPLALVQAVPPASRPALYVDCGRGDVLLAMNRKLHARLKKVGFPHVYHEYAGAHDWPSWRKRLPHALRFISNWVSDTGS